MYSHSHCESLQLPRSSGAASSLIAHLQVCHLGRGGFADVFLMEDQQTQKRHLRALFELISDEGLLCTHAAHCQLHCPASALRISCRACIRRLNIEFTISFRYALKCISKAGGGKRYLLKDELHNHIGLDSSM